MKSLKISTLNEALLKSYLSAHKLIITTFFLLFLHVSYAQNWTGNIDSDWNNSANWSSWPLNGQDLTINPAIFTGSASSPIISVNSVFSPSSIVIDNGGILTIAANLTTQDDVEIIGVGSQLVVDSGTFSVNPGGGGRLIIDLGSSMVINGGNTIVDERFIAGQDAVITINNGTASSGERLLMDLGGRFIQNGGSVSVAQTFAMADGFATSNSGYELNGGVLNINGEMALENEAGNFEPYFIMNGGILNLNGDLIWFGVAPGLGTPKVLFNSGSATITGSILNLPLSTVNMHLKIKNNASLTFNGSLIENIHANDSIIQMGNSTFQINNTNSIINSGIFYVENTTTTFNGLTTLQGTGNFQFHNLLIEPTKTLNQTNPSIINISGSVIKNGNFIANSNTIALNGNQAQEISGTGIFAAHSLTLDNTSLDGVNLLIATNISGHLQLNNGLLNTSGTSMLTVSDNATSSAGNSGSFVNGPMIKVGDDSFVFPIGKNNRWRRLGINAPVGSNSEFKAEYIDNSYSSISPVITPLSSVSNIEYWELNQLTGSSTLNIELYWEDASQSGITDCNELSIAHWNSLEWNNMLSTTTGSCLGLSNGTISAIAGSNTFGVFTFGFYSGVNTQNISICNGNSITIGNNTYNSTGTYIDVLQDINANDSIVITSLTINPEYIINNPQEICQGGNYMIGLNSYSVAGVYTDTLYSINGCDSIIVTDLSLIVPNTSVTLISNVLQSNSSNADSYQWVDCNNNYTIIIGENDSVFAPMSNGSYALIINENGCSDTTSCYTINTVEVSELTKAPILSIYPNPFQNYLNINISATNSNGKLSICDIMGKLVFTKENVASNQVELTQLNFEPGIYFIKYNDTVFKKIIKID